MVRKKRIGEILVEKGLVSATTIERVVTRSKQQNKKLGVLLEEIAIITEEEIADALSVQYGYKPIRNFAHYSFPQNLLELIPREAAQKHQIFPLKRVDGKLAVALADPTVSKILQNLEANLELKVIPFVATRKEIFTAISIHYLGVNPEDDTKTTILIVDDDTFITTLLKNTLTRYGYNCLTEADGFEGYRTALEKRPQLILTDKEMPKLDGYGFIAALKNVPETEGIPVILISGAVNADEEARILEKGFFDFMCKPVKEITLITRVRRALQYGGGLPVKLVTETHKPRK